MGLITACMGTSTVIHLVVFFLHFHFQLKQSGSFCRYRKALYFWSLGISLYLELFCFLSFITIVLRNLCSGTHRRNQQSGLHKIMNDVHVVISRKRRKWKCSGSCSSKAVIAWLWKAHNTDFFFATRTLSWQDCDNNFHPDTITIEMSLSRVKPVQYIVYSCCFIVTFF